jgi:hypothetical protein
MKTKAIGKIILVTAVMALTGCVLPQVGYVTSTQQMPMFSDKGQVKGMGTIGLNHIEVQAAYSPIKHFGIIANSYRGLSGYSPGKRRNDELGMGFYMSKNNRYFFEMYSLYSLGRLRRISYDKEMSQNSDIHEIDSKYAGYIFQVDIGFRSDATKKHVRSFALGSKYTVASYDHFRYEHKPDASYWRGEVFEFQNQQFEMLNIALTYREKIADNVNVLVQPAYHYCLTNTKLSRQFASFYSALWLTTAIEIDLQFTSKKRKAPQSNL